jgi:hypothetical protein
MATRTVKFLGKAYSSDGDVSLVVNVNGNEVYNGTVTTLIPTGTEETGNVSSLFTFSLDSSVTGWIPVTISANGGDAWFSDFEANYAGVDYSVPDGHDWTASDPTITVNTQPVDFYGIVNTNTTTSDGKRNFSITNFDGDTDYWVRWESAQINDEKLGDWHWKIPNGATISFELYIDPDLITLSPPSVESLRAKWNP